MNALLNLVRKRFPERIRRIKKRLGNFAWKLARRRSASFNSHISRNYRLRHFEHQPLREIPLKKPADPRINESFNSFKDHIHREFVFDIKESVYVESKNGFILSKAGKLFERSFTYSNHVESISFSDYARIVLLNGNGVKKIPAAISFRGHADGNYWHFFDDYLSKLRLLDSKLLSAGTPILVGRGLWKQKFFQEIIGRPPFNSFNWVLHGKLVLVERLFVSNPASLQKENLDYAYQHLAQKTEDRRDELIFLSRSKARGRTIENIDEISRIARDKGLKIVEADNLSFKEQIELFQNAKLVVAIHGAGLANTLFRGSSPLHLMEIFHPRCIHPHYRWLSGAYNFRYDAIVGDEVFPNGNFQLGCEKFARALTNFLADLEA